MSATLLTPPSLSPARIAQELVKLLPPDGPDVVIDCAGFASTLQVRPLLSSSRVQPGHASWVSLLRVHLSPHIPWDITPLKSLRSACSLRSAAMQEVLGAHSPPSTIGG